MTIWQNLDIYRHHGQKFKYVTQSSATSTNLPTGSGDRMLSSRSRELLRYLQTGAEQVAEESWALFQGLGEQSSTMQVEHRFFFLLLLLFSKHCVIQSFTLPLALFPSVSLIFRNLTVLNLSLHACLLCQLLLLWALPGFLDHHLPWLYPNFVFHLEPFNHPMLFIFSFYLYLLHSRFLPWSLVPVYLA